MREVSDLRWGVLLALLLVSILLEPVFGPSPTAEVISFGALAFAIAAALFSSVQLRRVRATGASLAFAWYVFAVLAREHPELHGLVLAFSAFILICALVVTFRNLMLHDESDFNTLMQGVFGYLLIAVTWAALYVQLERLEPGSFLIADTTDLWSSMTYYSLVTLTSLGYGDIVPLSSLARISAGFEAVFGVLYVAVMIGRIVGSYKNVTNKNK